MSSQASMAVALLSHLKGTDSRKGSLSQQPHKLLKSRLPQLYVQSTVGASTPINPPSTEG